MNASELKRNIERNRPESLFFSRGAMKNGGDTMRNYGVRTAKVMTADGEKEVWELYRRQATPCGFTRSVYWDKVTFGIVYTV
jgi:hypothetical protein